MKGLCRLRALLALGLCLVLAVPALPHIGGGKIGPSNGEIAGVVVGAGAALVGVGYLIYHETHKHPSITGCIALSQGGATLTSYKDKKVYALSGDFSALKDGEQVALQGKKSKDSGGKVLFQVEKVRKDLGVCHP